MGLGVRASPCKSVFQFVVYLQESVLLLFCTSAICVGIYRSPCFFLLVGHAFCLVFTGVRALAAHAITPFALVFIRVRAFCS